MFATTLAQVGSLLGLLGAIVFGWFAAEAIARLGRSTWGQRFEAWLWKPDTCEECGLRFDYIEQHDIQECRGYIDDMQRQAYIEQEADMRDAYEQAESLWLDSDTRGQQEAENQRAAAEALDFRCCERYGDSRKHGARVSEEHGIVLCQRCRFRPDLAQPAAPMESHAGDSRCICTDGRQAERDLSQPCSNGMTPEENAEDAQCAHEARIEAEAAHAWGFPDDRPERYTTGTEA